MARTESKTLTCHPRDEQEIINAMQQFHWSLLNSQDVKTVSTGLQKGSWGDDNIYSVTKTVHYVKLAFSRDVDMPHLNEIKKLESAYLGLPSPLYPNFLIHFVLCAVWMILGVGTATAVVVGITSGVGIYLFAPHQDFDPATGYWEDVGGPVLPQSLYGAYFLFSFLMTCGAVVGSVYVIWRWYWRSSYTPKNDEAQRVAGSNAQRRKEILAEMEKYR
jgi:hypothetical protein